MLFLIKHAKCGSPQPESYTQVPVLLFGPNRPSLCPGTIPMPLRPSCIQVGTAYAAILEVGAEHGQTKQLFLMSVSYKPVFAGDTWLW